MRRPKTERTTMLTSIRMPQELVTELKTLAEQETARTGERVTWAKLLREAARGLIKAAKGQRSKRR